MAKLDINSKYRMNSGYEIPVLGYGVYQTPADVAEDVVHHALKSGYRHVDSATVYRNEEASVAGINKFIKESGVPRSEIFFTSKVPPKEVNYEGAKKCINDSLSKTGLDYIDLYLLHAPYGGKASRLGAWKALAEAVQAGKVRSIGVSNYGVHHLSELEEHMRCVEAADGRAAAGVLSVNQVELHPWLARPDIVRWCEERGVLLQAYSPLVRGERMGEEVVREVAGRVGRTAAQVLVRWSLQMGFVPLPKSVTKTRIVENADVYGFELSREDMARLDTGEYAPCAWDPTTSKD